MSLALSPDINLNLIANISLSDQQVKADKKSVKDTKKEAEPTEEA
jgi:hypothetical protein